MTDKFSDSHQIKMLSDFLEEILFEKKTVAALLMGVNKLRDQSITPKEFKEQILDDRLKLLSDLLEAIPFYITHNQSSVSEAKPPNNKRNSEKRVVVLKDKFQEKLKMREDLLDQMADSFENMKEHLIKIAEQK